jgi:hypothetical protein
MRAGAAHFDPSVVVVRLDASPILESAEKTQLALPRVVRVVLAARAHGTIIGIFRKRQSV